MEASGPSPFSACRIMEPGQDMMVLRPGIQSELPGRYDQESNQT